MGAWAIDIPVMSSIILPSLVWTVLATLAIFRFRMSVITTLLISAGLGVGWTAVAMSGDSLSP